MRTSRMKRTATFLISATCGLVVLHTAGCRTFGPVDSFFVHLERFEPAFTKAFREECGQPDSSEYKFAWHLDGLWIKQQENLLTPYTADCVTIAVCGPDGRWVTRNLGWTFRHRDGKWHENGYGRAASQHNPEPFPCDIDVHELAARVNKGLIQ